MLVDEGGRGGSLAIVSRKARELVFRGYLIYGGVRRHVWKILANACWQNCCRSSRVIVDQRLRMEHPRFIFNPLNTMSVDLKSQLIAYNMTDILPVTKQGGFGAALNARNNAMCSPEHYSYEVTIPSTEFKKDSASGLIAGEPLQKTLGGEFYEEQ